MSAEQNDINNKKLEDFISNLGSAVSSSLVSGSTAAADGKNPQKATAGRSVSRLEILAAVARFWVPHIPLVSMATLEYYTYGPQRKSWPLIFHIILRLCKDFNKKHISGDVSRIQALTDTKLGVDSATITLSTCLVPRSTKVIEVLRLSLAEKVPAFNFPLQAEYSGFNHGNPENKICRLGFSGPGVECDWVIHKNAENSKSVVMLIHGGAYAIGSTRIYRPMAQIISRRSGAKVFMVNYRLAPQNPFPCALIDTLSAYLHLLSLGIASDKIVFTGDSAGGGLAMATLLALRDMGLPLPAGAIGMSPWVDLSHMMPSFFFNAQTDFLPSKSLDPMLLNEGKIHYYAPNEMLRNPYVSPLFASTLTGLPPLLIQVGQVERLRDECILFATRAATNAFSAHIFPEKWPTTHVQLEIYQDQVHVFQIFQFLKSSQVAMERACDFIQDVTMVPDRVKSSVSTRMLIGMDGRLIKKIGFDVGSNLDEHIESARL